jgi:hypothetical protein
MKHVYIDHQHYATHNGIKYTQIKYTEHSNKNFIATRESWYQNISIPKHEAFCDAHNTQNGAQPTPHPEYRCSWWFWHREQNSFLLGASSKLLRGRVWLESFNILQNWGRITTKRTTQTDQNLSLLIHYGHTQTDQNLSLCISCVWAWLKNQGTSD